ncbi:MAG TPA: glycosyltransferase family A protein [Candidatus Omnitrophota bacterium]|nr:glycosyltransferase family A protein [Candidatus Omnitrophota bacterium]HPN66751.1 glycosyltransferase family A protein [Candidatus Omnitrophota bacterium]
MAMVSVVIPTYNRAGYLKEAVGSALAQTHKDTEVIVVDDSSTDGTGSVAASFGDSIRYILQDNRERGAARNSGIRISKGEYVAFLDSDDLWLPEHLESCLRACESSGAEVSYSGSYVIDESGGTIGKLAASSFGKDPLREIVAGYSSRGCNASSCIVKKSAFGKAGYFSEKRELSGSEDWEMWARLASCCRMVFTGDYTAKVRFHPGKSSIVPERMAGSMKLALDMAFGNERLAPRIAGLEGKAYSRLYTVTAINYYAAGRMEDARRYLALAVKARPRAIVEDPLVIYTFLRTILGARASSALRNAKWGARGRK